MSNHLDLYTLKKNKDKLVTRLGYGAYPMFFFIIMVMVAKLSIFAFLSIPMIFFWFFFCEPFVFRSELEYVFEKSQSFFKFLNKTHPDTFKSLGDVDEIHNYPIFRNIAQYNQYLMEYMVPKGYVACKTSYMTITDKDVIDMLKQAVVASIEETGITDWKNVHLSKTDDRPYGFYLISKQDYDFLLLTRFDDYYKAIYLGDSVLEQPSWGSTTLTYHIFIEKLFATDDLYDCLEKFKQTEASLYERTRMNLSKLENRIYRFCLTTF